MKQYILVNIENDNLSFLCYYLDDNCNVKYFWTNNFANLSKLLTFDKKSYAEVFLSNNEYENTSIMEVFI